MVDHGSVFNLLRYTWEHKFIATQACRLPIHRLFGGPFGLAKAAPCSPALFGVPTRLVSLL